MMWLEVQNVIYQSRSDVGTIIHETLQKLVSILNKHHNFERLFIYNEYEGQGISANQVSVGKNYEIIASDYVENKFNKFMNGITYTGEEIENIEEFAVPFEETVQLLYGYDYIITAKKIDDKWNDYDFDWEIEIEFVDGKKYEF